MPLNTQVTQSGEIHEVTVNDGGGGGAKDRVVDVFVSWNPGQFLFKGAPGGTYVWPGCVVWPRQLINPSGKKFQVQLACWWFTSEFRSSRVVATTHDCNGSSGDYASHAANVRVCGPAIKLGPEDMLDHLALSLGISSKEAHELVERLHGANDELKKYLSGADSCD